MKKFAVLFGLFFLIAFGSCNTQKGETVLLTRDFSSKGWERFDFITDGYEVKKPITLNLSMIASFEPSYMFDYLSVVFTVFDSEDQPIRSKSYKFNLKDKDGTWKSELKDGCYTFTLPINSEMAFNEPAIYKLQLENRMPITPLAGIHHVSIVAK